MASAVKIRDEDHVLLKELSAKTGVSMQELLSRSISTLEKELFFTEIDRAYERLQSDPSAWSEYERERREWESLTDGLNQEPPYPLHGDS